VVKMIEAGRGKPLERKLESFIRSMKSAANGR
jgi:hypothetical protein